MDIDGVFSNSPANLVATTFVAFFLLNYSAHASVTVASSNNILSIINNAKCGDVIRVVGDLESKVSIRARPTCPVLIDLGPTKVVALSFQNASNWTVTGGEFSGAKFVEIQIIASDHLVLRSGSFHDYGKVGISLLDSSFVRIENNTFFDANADGVDVVSSQDVLFQDNVCKLTYSTTLHADCLQMWNKTADPLSVARITAKGNYCEGAMQCIDTFGTTDGRPVNDISILNNGAYISLKWAGAINNRGTTCIHCVMVGNWARTYPGMPHGWDPPGWYDGSVPAPGNTVGSKP